MSNPLQMARKCICCKYLYRGRLSAADVLHLVMIRSEMVFVRSCAMGHVIVYFSLGMYPVSERFNNS